MDDRKLFKVILGMIAVVFCLVVGFWLTVGTVAVHFLRKLW